MATGGAIPVSGSRRAFGLAIVVIVVTALTAVACVVWVVRDIRPATQRLVERAAPDVRDLSAARRELRRIETRVTRQLLLGGDPAIADLEPRSRLLGLLEGYCARPHRVIDAREGEEALRLARNLFDLEARMETAHAQSTIVAVRLVDDFGDAASMLDGNLERASQRLALRVETAAQDADRVRSRAHHLGVGLVLLMLFLSAAAGQAAWRHIRRSEQRIDDERRSAEMRALEFEVFAARVAHDIRSPLASVHLLLESALRSERDFERTRPFLRRAVASVDRVVGIVDGLFEFARAGGHPEPDARTDLADAVTGACAAVEHAAKKHSVRISCAAPAETVVAASQGVVTSIVGNLVQNAMKYCNDSTRPEVAIRVSRRGLRARVEVCDNGPGVPPDVRNHMFDPHVRSRDSRIPGIGLGLATVRRLCEAHGGAVGYEAIRSGGSCFWFELPLARAADSNASHSDVLQ